MGTITTIILILSLAVVSTFEYFLIRKQKQRVEELVRGLRADIKSLLFNQKVLYSSVKELNTRLSKYEKGQKANQANVIRPKDAI